ncbi:MAG: hypothetical protein Q7T63_16410 [Burkholderiaceae bacterium]|nr:hypothetical protein [Burkholderiaceae bacterium]MDO9090455.1 hypothetical protein [Burkholderiaceae bacterium]
MSGPEHILESKVGYYATVSTGIDCNAVRDRDLWCLARPKRKMHACCAFIHSSVEAMARLRRDRAPLADAHEIRIVADPALPHYYQAIVTLHDKTGAETHRAVNRAPKGSPENPMSDDEVRDKFRRLTRDKVDGSMLERYIARMERLEDEPDTDWIASLSA